VGLILHSDSFSFHEKENFQSFLLPFQIMYPLSLYVRNGLSPFLPLLPIRVQPSFFMFLFKQRKLKTSFQKNLLFPQNVDMEKASLCHPLCMHGRDYSDSKSPLAMTITFYFFFLQRVPYESSSAWVLFNIIPGLVFPYLRLVHYCLWPEILFQTRTYT